MIHLQGKILLLSYAFCLLPPFLAMPTVFSRENPLAASVMPETSPPSAGSATETVATTEETPPETALTPAENMAGLQEELRWLQEEAEVSIATRHETRISKAPAIITVVTAEEIKNMGFRNLADILKTVPGFEIIKLGNIGNVQAGARGTFGGNKIRMMVNGHLINDPADGGPFKIFDDFPVENIKRLEIIRGPGSAMYGENAFSAVINIITKDGRDVNGVRVSSGYGSFDTKEENILFGEKNGDVEFSGMVRYRDTDGFDGDIESDYQTSIDNQLSPFGVAPASLAPGETEDWARQFDTSLKISYKDVYFQGWYSNKDRGPFIGTQYALAEGSDLEYNYVFGEIGCKKTLEERLTFKPRLYYDQHDGYGYIRSLPKGSSFVVDTDGDGVLDSYNIYPGGLVGEGGSSQKSIGTEIPFDYELFDGNMLTLGLEYRLINQTNLWYSANFHPATFEPLDSLQDFTESYPLSREVTRRVWAVYLQDTWDITDTVGLTLGIRHDRYSDFGGTTNPRAGVTWAFMKDASLKALYGEAFRAPSFTEMYATNQPAYGGNEDLKPETIRSFEIGLSYKYFKRATSSINYFYNDIEDLIVPRNLPAKQSTTRYENYGDARIQGIEAETKIDLAKKTYVFMNYTFQEPEDDDGNNLPYVARNKGNVGVNVNTWKYVNTNLSAFASGRRFRDAQDTRDDLPAYALLNLSVLAKEFFSTMEIQGTIFNLLDKEYNDPAPVSVPGDLPRPGRTYFLGLSYQF